MQKKLPTPLKVFIGCPGDMGPERDALLATRDHIESVVCPVKFITWKRSSSGVGEAQRVIFENDPVDCFDIVIIIIWSRIGVPSGISDPLTKTEMTGTEAEFVAAYDLHQSHESRRPQLLLYRCSRHAEIDPNSPKLSEQMAQLQGVQKFFKQTETGGLRPMLIQSFKTTEELKEFVIRDIKTATERLLVSKRKDTPFPKKRSLKPRSANSGELLHRYFTGLRDQFSIYENVGLPVPERDSNEGERDAPIPIRRLFVEPACTETHFSPEAVDTALREGKTPSQPLLPHLAPARSRTVLLADPGMGKSTLIQWLISTLADEVVPPNAKKLHGAVPLPFILRDLVTHLPQEVKAWNWDALMDAFRQWRHRGKGAPLAAPLTADDAFFRSTLASPNAFFLIDGLDEIGDPQRRLAIRNAIWEGFEKYPQARWLITSRVVGYELAEVHQSGSSISDLRTGYLVPEELLKLAELLYLSPFDDKQQLTFAQNWYIPRLGDSAGPQRADDFMEAVRRHAHTRVISRVPNLLYLLALLFRHRARLPDGRALVYAAISSAYLADIDLGRHLPDSLVVPWKFEEKEDLLALVAMRMQEIRVAQTKTTEEDYEDNASETGSHGEILVTRAQLEEWLGPRFGGEDAPGTCAELNHFLDHIANRSGLLLPRGEGVFGFAHLSFQEYYSACFLEKEFRRILNQKAQPSANDIFGTSITAGDEGQEKMFAEMSALPTWHEPLLFLVEKLRNSAPDTHTFILWAFPQLADNSGLKSSLMSFTTAQLLAGISLDQEVSLDASQREKLWTVLWRSHIEQQSEELFPHNSKWHLAPWLLTTSAYQIHCLRAATALSPKRLALDDCNALSDLTPLMGCDTLEELGLADCTAFDDLSPLGKLPYLKGLMLMGATGVTDLSPLAGLKELLWLWLSGCVAVRDLGPLNGLTSLRYLSLSGNSLTDLKPLQRLASLVKFVLNDCGKIANFEPLNGLSSLEWLSINNSDRLKNLEPISGLKSLKTLWCSNLKALEDITPLGELKSLGELRLTGGHNVDDFKPLVGLKSLRSLTLRCKKPSDLNTLSKITSLETLDLSGSKTLGDLTPLANLSSLESLSLRGYKKRDLKGIETLRARLPNLKIDI